MRKTACAIVAVTLAAAVFAGPAAANTVVVSNELPRGGNAYIPKGTVIDVEMMTTVSSNENDVNDVAYFKLLQHVVVNGVVVLPAGTVGNAYVSRAKPAGFFGQRGGIELQIRTVQALNGAVVPVTMDIKKYNGTADHYIPFLLLGLYRAGFEKLAAYAAAYQWENQVIPAGTRFLVAVQADADLGCTPDRLPVVMIRR